MIPLRDKNPSSTFPFVNITLIVINVLAFFYELSLGPGLSLFIRDYGLVPAVVTSPGLSSVDRFYPFLTSMFLHGGFMHILGNMLYLYIFGDNVEDRLGHLKYLIFFLLAGFGAALSQFVFNTHSLIPMIGASGAISGVLGAYVLFFPKARVVTLIPIFYFIHITELPAALFLIIWFAMQFLSGISSVASGATGAGVAWWAHIGGFIFGLALAYILPKRKVK